MAYLQGILSDTERKHGRHLAEHAREARPDGMQRLLSSAVSLISHQRSRFNLREMAEFFLLVEQQYPEAERIFIALDNWPVHFHSYVLDTLAEQHNRITLLPRPSYAPWTNPMEKVWSQGWERLKQEVTRWLQAASSASEDLLRYVGLASVTDQLCYGT